jgi:hypothetical protein
MDTCQSITLGGFGSFPPLLAAILSLYLTADEKEQINEQFQGQAWRRNGQVMWSGMLREEAQSWADERGMQTLTTAMGPLMMPNHPLCLKGTKTDKQWTSYVAGASAIFAWHISQGEMVIVLSPPPPERFHPSGLTNYQAIEEPILKGRLGGGAVSCIKMVHPAVKGAENFCYQIWPIDDTHTWTAHFGTPRLARCWRDVRVTLGKLEIRKIIEAGVVVATEEAEFKEEAAITNITQNKKSENVSLGVGREIGKWLTLTEI